jgi:peptide/nickel transport system permease protein
MTSYLVRRILMSLALILVIATVSFSLIRILPGDPALMFFGESGGADPEAVAAIRAQLGLDRPITSQYISWMTGILRADLGTSLFGGRTVRSLLAYRLPHSIELIIIALLLAVIIGIPLGLLSAYRRASFWDVALNVLATGGIAAPVYVIGTVMVLVFAFQLKWLPATGFVDFRVDSVSHIRHLLLPVLALSVTQWAQIVRIMRSSAIDVLNQDFVRTARAKGVPEPTVALRHVLRNSLIPVVTIIALQMGRAIGSTVLVEAIFNWPGISSLLISSITRRDYPVIQGIVLLIGVLFILINLLTDLAYALLDPRIRYA